MKKKLLFTLLLVSVLTCLLAIGVSAETPTDYIEFGARFPGSDSYITVYTENAESDGNPRINFKDYKFYSDEDFTQEVDISTVTGLDFSVAKVYGSTTPVNRMTAPANPFTSCTEVKWFTNGYTSIGNNMFDGWTNLKTFDFGCLTTIDYNCFQYCGFEELVIPATITSLNNSVFKDCTSLTSVKFEGEVTSLGTSIFYGCTSLESIDFGKLSTIGLSMFNGCTALKSVSIPSTVTYIDDYAFQNCSGITTVSFSSATNLVTIDQAAFEKCTSLTSVALPEGLTTLGNCAFKSCSSLATLSLPTTLTTLNGSEHFWGTALTSVTGLENTKLTSISYAMFRGLRNWKPETLVLPNTVTTIGEYGLADVGMQNLVLGAGLTSMQGGSLTGCSSLVAIYVPEGLDTLYLSNSSTKLVFVTSSDTTIVDGIKADTGFTTDVVSYADYSANSEKYASGKYVISGYNKCLAFYKDVHTSAPINDCQGQCSVCGKTTVLDAPSHKNVWLFADENGEAMNVSAIIVASNTCSVCGTVEETKNIDVIFTPVGYSQPETGEPFLGYEVKVNQTALKEYQELSGETVQYGLLAGIATTDNGTPLSLDGEGKVVSDSSTVIASMTGNDYSSLEIKITGINKTTSLYCNAFAVTNAKISYICTEVSDTATKKDIVVSESNV